MDLKTGKVYGSKAEALADGVSEADLFKVIGTNAQTGETRVRAVSPSHSFKPTVIFSKGSFKNAVYDERTGIVIPGRLAPR